MLCNTVKRNVASLATRRKIAPAVARLSYSTVQQCTAGNWTLPSSSSRPHRQSAAPTRLSVGSGRYFTTTKPSRILPLNNVSHVQGPTDVPLLSHTLGEFWDSVEAKYPTSMALISRHEAQDQHDLDSAPGHIVGEGEDPTKCLRWTYEDLGRAVDALARGLLEQGIKKGDRVGVFLGNNSTYACLQWATAKVGLIVSRFFVKLTPATDDTRPRFR